MTPDQRMKWDAEAAFKRIDEGHGYNGAMNEREYLMDLTAYAPPSNIGPERLAQLRKYEPPAKPKTRDYDAILRAAKKAPVGYYEDAPTGIKFGKPPVKPVVRCIPRKPAPTQSADGGKPLPSAGSKPHGKDVDTADGPWPKWLIADTYTRRFDGPIGGCTCYYKSGRVHDDPLGGWDLWGDDPRVCTHSAALQWLEQNGHADAAAQLRGKEEFEPAGTIAREGDTVVWPWHQYDSWRRVPHTLRYTAPCFGLDAFYDGYMSDVFSKPDGDPLALRILKRPVADNAIPRDDVATGGGRV